MQIDRFRHTSCRRPLQTNLCFLRPPQTSGSACTYDQAAPGLNPEHNIYVFDIFVIEINIIL